MSYSFMFDYEGISILCTCDYDYCVEEGPSGCLTAASIAGWDVMPLITKEIREEIEDYFLLEIENIEYFNQGNRKHDL